MTTWTNSYAGYFDGNVYINGVGTGVAGTFYSSDQNIKTNIDTITNALGIIKQLKPKQFYFDTTNSNYLYLPGRKQYGLIAQEVESILPELVSNSVRAAILDSAGNVIAPDYNYKSLNYNAFIAILMKGLQEQQKTIDYYKQKDSIQDARLTALENTVASCCANTNVKTTNPNQIKDLNSQNVNLSDEDVIVLNQNQPNPFAEKTTITYNVPSSYSTAQLIFTTIDGRVIKTIDLKKGRGQLNVFAQDLSTGMYVYSLVVDGKTVESKKMVKQD